MIGIFLQIHGGGSGGSLIDSIDVSKKIGTHWRSGKYLLHTGRKSGKFSRNRFEIFPIIVGLGNLILISIYDARVHDDYSGYYLNVIFLIQLLALSAIDIGIFVQRGHELLRKTLTLPLSAGTIYMYLIQEYLSNSVTLYVGASTAFAFIVLFYSSFLLIVISIGSYVIMIVTFHAIIAFVSLKFARLTNPSIAIISLGAVILLSVFASRQFFHSDMIIQDFPVISWSVELILSFRKGMYINALEFLGLMLGVFSSIVFLGLRVHSRS